MRMGQNYTASLTLHTYAKLIEIQKNYLQKIHGLHELGSHIGSHIGSHT